MESLRRLACSLSGSSPSLEITKAAENFFLLFERIIRELLTSNKDWSLMDSPSSVPQTLLDCYEMMSSVLIELLNITESIGTNALNKINDKLSTVPSWCEALADCASKEVPESADNLFCFRIALVCLLRYSSLTQFSRHFRENCLTLIAV